MTRNEWKRAWRAARAQEVIDDSGVFALVYSLLVRDYRDPLQRPLWKRLANYKYAKHVDYNDIPF